MSRRVFEVARVAAVVLSGIAALSGCGTSDEEAAASQQADKNARAAAAARDDMVSAVSAGRNGALVDLKFALAQRPAVGEALDIKLALTPSVELEHLFARFQAAEGLELIQGAETEHLDRPAPGVPVSHTVIVKPKTDGIFYVIAVVLADSATESVARSFTIPIIAGAGLAELPAAPPAASVVSPRPAPPAP